MLFILEHSQSVINMIHINTMRTSVLRGLTASVATLAVTSACHAVVVDFVGGTAYFDGGGSAVVNLGDLYNGNVDYYVEDGIKVDFVGGTGIIGDYYSIGSRPAGAPPHVVDNVIHAHWFRINSIVFSKVDGSLMDLNYMDLTSNSVVGGGQCDGTESSWVTSLKGTMKLPSSDWGYDFDYYGTPGDGVARLWMDSNFQGISSFTVTSENAYCFGLDNFYIDQAAPPHTPDAGATAGLLGLAMAGLMALRKRG